MNTLTLNPQIVGQAENAHGAIMNVVLAGTGLNRDRWVVLTLTTSADGPLATAALTGRVTGAPKISEDTTRSAIAELVAAGLLAEADAQITATDTGRALFTRLRGTINQIVARAYSDVSAEDLETAARVLTTITAGLNRELATLT
jgi:hypothetical protein